MPATYRLEEIWRAYANGHADCHKHVCMSFSELRHDWQRQKS